MNQIDTSRDEVRQAGVLEALAGRWRFAAAAAGTGNAPVDVDATNEALVLSGRRLGDFTALHPDDARVLRFEKLPPPARAVAPTRIGVILLCGGMSSRSGGTVHPLRRVEAPGGRSPTLLDLKLDILGLSPLAASRHLVAGSLLNEAALREHLRARETPIFVVGLAPLLAPEQKRSGTPTLFRDQTGGSVYMTTGHLDALRWLVGSGALAELVDVEVLIVASYSNWGRIFTSEALLLAGRAAEYGRSGGDRLFALEVTSRPKDKKTGSLLVDGPRDLPGLRLVKYAFGSGSPRYPDGDRVLMSTNTLYVNVGCLRASLEEASRELELPVDRRRLQDLLEDARRGQHRAEALAIFDHAFPICPMVSLKTVGARQALHAERLLDQLALIPGPSLFEPVLVPPERGISIKLPTDLEDPMRRALLFR